VLDSTHESYKIEELPMRFEAGLQDYSGIIGLGEACRYLTKIGLSNVKDHEVRLNKLVSDSLLKEPKISILGPKEAEKRNGVFSFNIKGMSPHDVSKILDSSKSIMTRSGMHCVHSWFNKRKLNGSVRASMYLYNTEEEANVFVDEVKKIIKIM